MTVIVHELDFYRAMCDKVPEDRDYYEAKIESLTYSQGNLETQIQNGLTTIESYMASVKKYL